MIVSKTFRVFVSSTFSDLNAERDALQERVFLRLRELCMGYGARFQAIDLRRGVSEEASHDQQTMNICLKEINSFSPVYFHLFMVGWVTQLIFGVFFWMFPEYSKEQPPGGNPGSAGLRRPRLAADQECLRSGTL